MRVNVYAEELTDRVEIVRKTVEGKEFVGLRIYLYLPVGAMPREVRGPFFHRDGDDDSSAVTFWCDGIGQLDVLAAAFQTAVDAVRIGC